MDSLASGAERASAAAVSDGQHFGEDREGDLLGTPASEIEASNAAIRGYNHEDGTRDEILSAAGISDDGSILDAVNLNNLDDWTTLHGSL